MSKRFVVYEVWTSCREVIAESESEAYRDGLSVAHTGLSLACRRVHEITEPVQTGTTHPNIVDTMYPKTSGCSSSANGYTLWYTAPSTGAMNCSTPTPEDYRGEDAGAVHIWEGRK